MSCSTLVTVCAACLHASCWQGAFYCEDYISAGTVEKTVAELQTLRKLGVVREHPSWWDVCPERGVAKRACYCADCKKLRASADWWGRQAAS